MLVILSVAPPSDDNAWVLMMRRAILLLPACRTNPVVERTPWRGHRPQSQACSTAPNPGAAARQTSAGARSSSAAAAAATSASTEVAGTNFCCLSHKFVAILKPGLMRRETAAPGREQGVIQRYIRHEKIVLMSSPSHNVEHGIAGVATLRLLLVFGADCASVARVSLRSWCWQTSYPLLAFDYTSLRPQ